MKNKKLILPFLYDALTSFPFIERDFDALTLYEFQQFTVKKINELIDAYNKLDTDDVIKEVLNEWLEDGTLEEIIKESYGEFLLNVGLLPKTVRGNVELNIFHEEQNIQGGCCIGGNKIVTYSPSANSNVGVIECFDVDSKQLLWSESIEGYHGNTLSYDGDSKIYITACLDQTITDSNLLNLIQVFDINQRSVVETITLPFTSYSTVYYKGKFYTFKTRDFTEGVDNVVTISDIDGSNQQSIILKDYISVIGGRRTQGISTIKDDIIYITDHNTRTIYGYDLKGNLAYIGQIEQIMNKYRWIGELEFIDQMPDDGRWFIGSVVTSTGEHSIRLGTVAQVGLYNEIPIVEKKPEGVTPTSPRALDAIVVVTNSKQLDPEQEYPHWVATLDDAVNLVKSYNAIGRIRIDYDALTYKGLAYAFSHFTGRIYGTDIPVYNIMAFDCNMTMTGLDFTDSPALSHNIDGSTTIASNFFAIRSKIEGLNWSHVNDTDNAKYMFMNFADVMLSGANINVNRIAWSKLGTKSNWTGTITDADPFNYYQYTLN